MQAPIPLSTLNASSPQAFCVALAAIWENADWVPAQVLHLRPFASVDALHQAMLACIAKLPDKELVLFLAGHPELGGTAARAGTMTAASVQEQTSQGFTALADAEAQQWDALNQQYRARFGFPFIICVRQHTRDSAWHALQQRLHHDRTTEMHQALQQIAAITRLRLADCTVDDLIASRPSLP